MAKMLRKILVHHFSATVCLLNPIITWPKSQKLWNGQATFSVGQDRSTAGKEKNRPCSPLLNRAPRTHNHTTDCIQSLLPQFKQQIRLFSQSQNSCRKS